MTETHHTHTDRRTLGETSHTNPYTDEAFGRTQTYARGRRLAADGGTPDAVGGRRGTDGGDGTPDETGETDESTEPGARNPDGTLRDVDHTPRENAPEASRAYMRGNEDDEDDDE